MTLARPEAVHLTRQDLDNKLCLKKQQQQHHPNTCETVFRPKTSCRHITSPFKSSLITFSEGPVLRVMRLLAKSRVLYFTRRRTSGTIQLSFSSGGSVTSMLNHLQSSSLSVESGHIAAQRKHWGELTERHRKVWRVSEKSHGAQNSIQVALQVLQVRETKLCVKGAL